MGNWWHDYKRNQNRDSEALGHCPEDVLKDLLQYLKETQKQSKDQAALASHLRKIIREDRDLLEKLAK